MRIACFDTHGRTCAGVVAEDLQAITPLELSPAEAARGVLPIIERLARGERLPRPAGAPLPIDSVRLLAPLPRACRSMFRVDRNYHPHLAAAQACDVNDDNEPARPPPVVFDKLPKRVVGPNDAISLTCTGRNGPVDFEGQLAVVIGAGGKNISRADAMCHVFGYTIVSEITPREVPARHAQWDPCKSFDCFCTMGPWIVSADRLDGLHTRVRRWVNDELRQDALTEQMIVDIPTLIETLSRGTTLYPGEVIATGTPAGVGDGPTPQRWLRPGDRVRIEIDGIGRLENRVF